MLNPLLRWLGVVADWCMLAEASLSVEAMASPSHLVNNAFGMSINAQYLASVEGRLCLFVK